MAARPSKRKSGRRDYVNTEALFWAEAFLKMPMGPKTLLLFLARKGDNYGCSYYKQEDLADNLGCSPRSVQAHLRSLQNYGLIRIIGRCETQKQVSNVYHVIGWVGREQLPPLGHPKLGKYIKEPTHADYLEALRKQNSVPQPAESADHNNNTKILTTSGEGDVLETCIAALGSWIGTREKNLLRDDYLSLFHLIEHGYGVEAHILPLLRKKAETRRKARLIRTWDYFGDAIAEHAATVEKELDKAFREVPQRKLVRTDPKEEKERAALQQIFDSVKRMPPGTGLGGGAE
ncbi:helix-turn-helix domain-containing protein [Paracoccus everestensis]|uniref:helix-turn-helix domain-containing protein n=1 Tax=Paracoccus everestensis TaxID=2903900 RepID=UPI001F32EEF8|nr:helix-turn-helix domain-containing protein [Paracoccus everestensis]